MPSPSTLCLAKGTTDLLLAYALLFQPSIVFDSPITAAVSRFTGLVSLPFLFRFVGPVDGFFRDYLHSPALCLSEITRGVLASDFSGRSCEIAPSLILDPARDYHWPHIRYSISSLEKKKKKKKKKVLHIHTSRNADISPLCVISMSPSLWPSMNSLS